MALFRSKGKEGNQDVKDDSGQSTGDAKQKSVREMSGYDSISAVRSAAPESTAGESFNIHAPADRLRTGAGSVRGAAPKKLTKEELVAAEKEKQRLRALETVGKEYMRKLASVPYDSWAMLAADSYYKLKPEEAKELADSYYILAQSTNIDFSNPWVMGLGILSLHAVLIADRLKHMNRSEDVKAMEELNKEAAKPN